MSNNSGRPGATLYSQGRTNNTFYRPAKKILCIWQVENRIFSLNRCETCRINATAPWGSCQSRAGLLRWRAWPSPDIPLSPAISHLIVSWIKPSYADHRTNCSRVQLGQSYGVFNVISKFGISKCCPLKRMLQYRHRT